MVVTHPILVARCRPGRLNAPDQTPVGQHADRVIHRSLRDGADVGPDEFEHIFRGEMSPARHRPQDGQALRGDLETPLPKELGGVHRHDPTMCEFLRHVKTPAPPTPTSRARIDQIQPQFQETRQRPPEFACRALHPSASAIPSRAGWRTASRRLAAVRGRLQPAARASKVTIGKGRLARTIPARPTSVRCWRSARYSFGGPTRRRLAARWGAVHARAARAAAHLDAGSLPSRPVP